MNYFIIKVNESLKKEVNVSTIVSIWRKLKNCNHWKWMHSVHKLKFLNEVSAKDFSDYLLHDSYFCMYKFIAVSSKNKSANRIKKLSIKKGVTLSFLSSSKYWNC